jgi:stage III sporulation protein AG
VNELRELFKNKDKKVIVNIGAALAVGVFLLIIGSSFFKTSGKDGAADAPGGLPGQSSVGGSSGQVSDQSSEESDSAYETRLEKRLEACLSTIAGVGKVKVMLTLSYGREIIVAEDKTSNETKTKETDAQGGDRTAESRIVDEKNIIITDKNGGSRPLILKEIQPKVEGVLIVAEGGDNVYVKEALTYAAEAVLGLSANKIVVSKMKK